MTNSPQILIITNLDDFAVDYLILKLRERDIHYLRINSEDISNWSIAFNPFDGIILQYEDSCYYLSSVNGVYFRRAPTIFKHLNNNENRSFLWRECKEFLEGIYLTLNNANWMNPIYETYRAERKLYQLTVANKLGFKIPKSLVTNNASTIKKFISQKECIIKPISHGLQTIDKEIYSIYTSNINNDLKFDSDQLFESPVYIQEKIENQFDIRVTVIGNKLFPVSIKKDKLEEVDWRKPEIFKEYHKIKIPTSVAEKCIQINKNLGLLYSAIDLIRSKNGEYTFLEINPAGEWVWLEEELGLPLSETIIEELIKK